MENLTKANNTTQHKATWQHDDISSSEYIKRIKYADLKNPSLPANSNEQRKTLIITTIFLGIF